jgi:hypothetical protein
MNKPAGAKKMVRANDEVLGRYDSRTRDEMVAMLDESIAALPEACRASSRFKIDIETYAYDSGEYPKLFIEYERPETDEEQAKRETLEATYASQATARDKAEFERLSKLFGPKA